MQIQQLQVHHSTFLGQDPDLTLVQNCQKGDPDSFETLVQKHQAKMVNLANKIVGDFEVADEVVQDAFFSAYKNILKFRGESKFSSWLGSIVINQAKTRGRQIGLRLKREEPIDDGQEVQREFPSLEPSALEQLMVKEAQAKVVAGVNSLGSEFRDVIKLDLQGLTYDEIGNRLNLPDGTVKSRLHRARVSLKNFLEEDDGIEKVAADEKKTPTTRVSMDA
jgi:RNA polymerase sigma-70 factor (ECF subfamily)